MNNTDPKQGLTTEEARKREKNKIKDESSRSYKAIFLQNTFTFFNIVNFALAALVFMTGSYRNMLFLGVVLSNMVIGIVQEVRSKQVLDKLALIHQELACVIRDGREQKIAMEDIAKGDKIGRASCRERV